MSLRPNPLSPGRASPFRRPESPSTPTYQSNRPSTPSRLNSSTTLNGDGTWSPSTQNLRSAGLSSREPPPSPTRNAHTPSSPSTARNGNVASAVSSFNTGNNVGGGNGSYGSSSHNNHTANGSFLPSSPSGLKTSSHSPAHTASALSHHVGGSGAYNTDGLAKLPAAQVRELREAFSILDRSGSGSVGRDDVADMLGQVGLANDERAVAAFFSSPSGGAHPMPMAAFLAGISGSLARMSAPGELLAALAAFDDDDSGQIDTAELVEALMGAPPPVTGPGAGKRLARHDVEAVMQDFTGRRAFSKYSTTSSLAGSGSGGLNRGGDVFRYREWVAGLGPVGAGQGEKTQAA